MRVIKSDGRHNFYDKGFRVIFEFRTRVQRDQNEWGKYIELLDTLYGPPRYNFSGTQIHHHNENYRLQRMSDLKRRRIYLKDESIASYLLLMIGNT
jgi:hypothetical protein